MGAWGTGNWENDSALDFLADVVEGDGITSVARTFDDVLRQAADEPIDASLASETLAAGELIAACLGRSGVGLPNEAVQWVSSHERNVDPRLQSQAVEAVRLVRRASELKELWEEAGEEADWFEIVDNLISRLNSNPVS